MAAVTLLWQEAIREGLKKDVQLRVIKRVPLNMLVRWKSRMISVLKHDGLPQMIVDYNAVNVSCLRQTHYTPSKWQAQSQPEHINLYSIVGMDSMQ